MTEVPNEREVAILDVLAEADEPLGPGRIGADVNLASEEVEGIMQGLENDGLVARSRTLSGFHRWTITNSGILARAAKGEA